MAVTKTYKFLPEIFQTETNKKFLNATLDQLISEPNFKKVNGYIGRKFAPTYKTNDSYVVESDALRQQYQLEPSAVVYNPESDTVDFYSSYIDLINKIKHYGGNVDDHSRLFNSEVYSYDGKFDFDKFVNFSQYYWMPDGPDSVLVSASNVPMEYTFNVIIDAVTGAYKLNNGETNQNITLAYGGRYTFNVTSGNFWLQTEPGKLGTSKDHPNISTREVFGVSNNGTGVVTFNVPLPQTQSRFTEMTIAASVDYGTSLAYRDIQGATLSTINNVLGGIDGVTPSVDTKKIIFVGNQLDDYYWTANGYTVPLADRTKVWVVQQATNGTVTLVQSGAVAANQQVYIKGGFENSAKSYYLDYDSQYRKVPAITAPLSTLYYQNGTSGTGAGTITLVDPAAAVIDIAGNIIGKSGYTSPNGIVFTNGLKITFDSTVNDSSAVGKDYYVEGVGSAIRLVAADDLTATELGNDLTKLDYLTVNRSSIDLNAWSRSNRWFHIDVLKAMASYNGMDLVLDQNARANRPIIEFNADIQLFNHGSVAKKPVDILDTVITNAFTQVESRAANNATTLTVTVGTHSVTLTHGTRVIFSNETNNAIRTQVYDFTIVNISETLSPQYIGIIVAANDDPIVEGNCILVRSGQYAGKSAWYNGTNWIIGQQKTSVNQAPLFDVFNKDNISFGDVNTYTNSSFIGTKLFGYKIGTGSDDPSLGFPLSYRTFNNIGDIQFENSFDYDKFTYLISPSTNTVEVNSGYLRKNINVTTYDYVNVWTVCTEPTKQYQLLSHVADGKNNLFEIDILPNPSVNLPNIRVLINSKNITVDNFGLTQVGMRYAVLVNPLLLTEGDSVDILIYSSSISKSGYYQVPSNLDVNSLNQNFPSLTLGQLRNHLVTLGYNSQLVKGDIPGPTNLRDISIKQQGGSILKHSAPVIYSNLFLVDNDMNFVEGLKLAQREYNKIKNKVLELTLQLEVDVTDIPGTLDKVMYSINGIKNSNFPWYYSDMIPWGENKTTLPPYTILDPRIRKYELSKIFNPSVLSNIAVLVYLTRTVNNVKRTDLMVLGQDYIFDQDSPSITILDTFNLNYDDVLTIVEYNNTDGNYIPETPTKMGLWPKSVPTIFMDDTYANGPVKMIQGHDGSLTPAFNDYRDDVLLEFERRIYNNIKLDASASTTDIYGQFPGRFRDTNYSLKEYNQILSTSFLSWVGNNRLVFTTNDYFQSGNPWTWNYKKFKDVLTGEYLPGTWRAIFDYYYDTDRPHTAPWEMLGFLDKPTWWEDRYGPAPYTGGNLVLWTDLSLGYIHDGPRKGIDPAFARPGLLKVIPVDESGNLRSPEKFAVLDFDSTKANASYAVGDFGPVETAWRKSSDFPFALQMAFALAIPGYYFSTAANIDRVTVSPQLGQYLVTTTNQHITPTDIEVNGYINANGVVQRTAGYINWISDRLKNLGMSDPQSKIKSYLKNLNVNLSYKAAGFTDKKYIKVLAEQGSPSTTDSIIIPDDNYKVDLFKSVPINKIAYSAVIVERSQNGYTVSGYNLDNPYFTTVPSVANNNAYTIKAGNATGTVYKDYQKVRVRIPYGYEFNNQQQVVDFLVSYQRQLQSQGFVFTDFDYDLGVKQDWVLSAQEFLTWAQQGWKPGNVLILSPVNQSITVKSANAVVDEIRNTPSGSKMMDPNFAVIKASNFTVSREDNTFSVTSIKGQTIAFAELHLVQYEHVLIFDNKTAFNDVIYSPDTGNRQYRLKFIGSKTANWTGALNPPGFIYNNSTVDDWQPGIDYKKGELVSYKTDYYVALDTIVASDLFSVKDWKQIAKSSIKTGLLPNFATNAAMFENIYDIDNQPYNEEIGFYSNGFIGFRERKFLSDLAIDVETQAKFYSGYIKQKGTKNAILALAQAQLVNISNEINVNEEWAVRVGEYGATDSNKFVEMELNESSATSNPVAIQLLNSTGTPEAGINYYRPADLYAASRGYQPNVFDEYESSADKMTLPVAGYVNVDDIDDTIFDIANYASLGSVLSNIGTGYTIWSAKGFNGDWDVYRISETQCQVVSVNYAIDSFAILVTNQAHHLQIGDIIAFKNFDSRFDGFYQVYDTPEINQVLIGLRQNYDQLKTQVTVAGSGILYKLTSARIATPHQIDSVTPEYGWAESDKVWVDSLDDAGNWGVYNKTNPWIESTKTFLNSSEYLGADTFGSSICMSPDGSTLFVGAPNSGTGRVGVFIRLTSGEYIENSDWIENSNFTNSASAGVGGFGQVVVASSKTVAVAAPTSHNNRGHIYVFAFDIATGISIDQVITSTTGTDNMKYGTSMSMSDDGLWLYVGEPGAGKVYAYGRITTGSAIQTITATGSNNDFVLNDQTVRDPSDILVTSAAPYIPNAEYQIVNVGGTYKLRFVNDAGTTTPPTAGSILISFHSHYKLMDTWTGNVGFGTSVRTNATGSQIVVGAPNDTVDGVINGGQTYVYDRMIEGFVASGSNNTFVPNRPIQNPYRVAVDGVVKVVNSDYYLNGNTIQFVNAPAAGKLVTIETNVFNRIQTIAGRAPSVTTIRGDGVHTSFYLGSTSGTVSKVTLRQPGTLNDITLSSGVNYTFANNTITFATVPVAGALINITIDAITTGQTMGTSVDISRDLTAIYSSAPLYTTANYRSGAVYRFINQGRVFGSITGTVYNPTVTSGHSIRINDVELIFAGGTLASVINKINGSGLDGVVATNVNGHLVITSSIVSSTNKLDILPGAGTALSDLGLNIFVQAQTLLHNNSAENESFGTTIKIGDDNTTLAIASSGAKTQLYTTIDSSATGFDRYSTNFADNLSSGAVYVYDLMDNPYETVTNPAQFAFVQKLVSATLDDNFNFGAALDIRDGFIHVGASYDSTVTARGGSVYSFGNTTGTKGWDLIRTKQVEVDPQSIDKAYIYSKKSRNILARLDHYNPAKGKILGIAQQDIDYISETDPAIYNDGLSIDANVDVRFDSSFHWSDLQVGKVWWDISTVKYIDYEQDSLVYRSKHWGDVFPGSVINVYEWVESSYLPSEYVTNVGDGVPKDTSNNSYVSYTTVNPVTGLFRTLYYYWVKGKTTVDTNVTHRRNSVNAIQMLVENPRSMGIAYMAPIARNAMTVYNIHDYLSADDAVLHIDYSPATDTNIIHSEYELIQENSGTDPIPTRIVNKMQDSLAGVDSYGLTVPDPGLTPISQIGIEIRPRQSMFVDRFVALKNFIGYVNTIVAQYPIAYTRDISALYKGADQPVAGSGVWDLKINTRSELDYINLSGLVDGYRVLVNKDQDNNDLWTVYEWDLATSTWNLVMIQSYLTSIYWDYIDWYASDFDYTVKPTFTVDHYYQINTLNLTAGNIVKLNDNGNGAFVFFRVTNTGTLDQVGIQNGTIKFSDTIYDLATGNMAFDNDNFDTVRFDQNPIAETRIIFDTVHSAIFIDDLAAEFNKLFFSLVNYIFSEQQSVDWIFKTSFITVLHKIRELAQYPSFVKDNQTFYEDYINEVKPYRTQIREYVPLYNGTDYLHTGVSDFDLPPYYDTLSSTFRSPDGTYATDAGLLTTSNYVDWNNHHTYSVTSINIDNGGTGFTFVPNITISGGGGSGAIAHAVINNTYGNISSVRIVNPGSGYTTTPTVTVNGNGTGAVLVPQMQNVYYAPNGTGYNTVRTFDTEMIFDRVGFYANVVDWAPSTAYTATITVGSGDGNIRLSSGNLVAYSGQLYYPFNAGVTTETTFDSSLYQSVYPANALVHANERVMGFYQPTAGMPDRNINTIFKGIDYPGVRVTGVKYSDFSSNVNVGTGIAFYGANSSIVSTTTDVDFVELGYALNQQITVIGSTKNNKVFSIVDLTANTMIVDTAIVTTEAAGANVTFRYLNYNDVVAVDSQIQSTYLDTALGTRPEDINVDGGAYVDKYSSHAPEELLPGRVYDTLDMTVYTANTSAFSTAGFKLDRITITNPGFGYTANDLQVIAVGIPGSYLKPTLAANGAITSITIVNTGGSISGNSNPVISIVGANVVAATATAYIGQSTYGLLGYKIFRNMNGGVEYTRTLVTTILTQDLSLTDTVIHVADANILQQPNPELAKPGVVYINGEKIVYYSRDTVNNTIGQLRRGVDGTGAPLVHAAGSVITEAGATHSIPDTVSAQAETFVASGSATEFTCTQLNANLSAYTDSVKIFIDGSENTNFILEQTTPVIKVKLLDTAPTAGANVTVTVNQEITWLTLAPGAAQNIITDTGENIITDSADNLTTTGSGNAIVDGTGLINASTVQAKFIKGQV